MTEKEVIDIIRKSLKVQVWTYAFDNTIEVRLMIGDDIIYTDRATVQVEPITNL